ncbi:OLC1v1019838C1 [Oldenlandia corymbosa var. corymbosa]|uniref:OLC1v1019838C1 n=1 Tax=Oldenlandia corymbosa var. corymbosa TaxID=529605 RepID=A0AAV1EF60_OLDCO|nr:OLC1v1019838C1 [Oldenlandia corymbosa var. corymbosa]
MDDYFFHYWDNFQFQGNDVLWFDDDLLPKQAAVSQRRSDFISYSKETLQGIQSKRVGNRGRRPNDQNVHKRMMEMLKKRWESEKAVAELAEAERERNHKHMINERMRRVKQRQGYVELHKLLPHGTKSDKNSIVQTAAETIEQLQRGEEQLKRRKLELEMMMAMADEANLQEQSKKQGKMEEAKIRLRVVYPSSGIDSLLGVMKSLKHMDVKTKSLQSSISSQEFSAVLQVQAKKSAAVVEKEVQKALYEVERKFRCAT